jgi:hypothetical protein
MRVCEGLQRGLQRGLHEGRQGVAAVARWAALDLEQRLDSVLGLELLQHEGGEGGEVDRDEVVAAVLGTELGELLLLLLRRELEVEVLEHRAELRRDERA